MKSTIYMDDEEVHTFVVLPPDGGWGIMVVFCSFICHLVIDGNIYTFGIFLDPISNEFGIQMAETSVVGAVLNGVCYMVGPFVSACLNRYDFRCVAITGCVVAAGGYVMSAFSINYYMYLVGQGILVGIGFGMLYVPALVMPSMYFAKWRAVAVSLATCGTGVGTLAVPNAFTIIIEQVGWRNTYLIMIGLVAVAAFASLSFIPLQAQEIVSDQEEEKHYPLTSVMQFHSVGRKRCMCCHWGNRYFPTTGELVPLLEAVIVDESESSYGKRTPYFGASGMSIARSRGNLLSAMSYAPSASTGGCCTYCWFNFVACICCTCCQTPVRPMYRDDIFYNNAIHLIPQQRKRAIIMKRRMQRRKARKKRQKEVLKEEKKRIKAAIAGAKKSEQERIAKLMKERAEKLRATTSQADEREKKEDEDDMMDYHMDVTHVTTTRELYDHLGPCCTCSIAGVRALTTLLDFRIMKSMAFLVLALNGFVFTLGYMIPFMFIAERAMEYGISKSEAVSYISMIGAANTIGRIISGFLPCVVKINCVLLVTVCCILQGAFTACSGFMTESWFQIVYVCSYGLLAGPCMALRTIIVVEVFGLENLTNIFGLQLMFSGISAICGPSIAGVLRDATKTYTYSFYFSGLCIIASAILLFTIKYVRNWEVQTGFVNF